MKTKTLEASLLTQAPESMKQGLRLYFDLARAYESEAKRKAHRWAADWIEQGASGESPEISKFAATMAMSIRAAAMGPQPEDRET